MFGYEIGTAPSTFDATGVFIRLVDGLAFRYHWATHELRPDDLAFQPGPESMTLLDLLRHVLHLAFMVEQTVMNLPKRKRVETEDAVELRAATLATLSDVRDRLVTLTDEELAGHQVLRRSGELYPVWNILNGPLADALTHVGQIISWRRLSGNPSPPVDVFGGIPPEPSAHA